MMRIANCMCVEHIPHRTMIFKMCKGSLMLKGVHQHQEEDEATGKVRRMRELRLAY